MRDVVDEVGKDVVRFIMLTRKNDAPLDFDLAKVTEQSKDNPVFYVQYAHARICSVFRNAGGPRAASWRTRTGRARPARDPSELRSCASSPPSRVVEAAAKHREPHRIAFYLQGLAGVFHGLWTRGKEEPGLRFLRRASRADPCPPGPPGGGAGWRSPRARPDGRAPGRGNALKH